METVLLTGAAFLGGWLSAAVGVGNVILLLVMSEFFEPFTCFSVYSAYTMAGGIMRLVVDFRSICWLPMLRYTIGCALGALAAFPFVGMLNGPVFLVGISVFVLFTLWTPRLHLYHLFPQPFSVCGFLQVSLGMLFGTSGPMPTIFLLDSGIGRNLVVATSGAMQLIGDTSKTLAFLAAGFDYAGQAPLLGLLCAALLAGTLLGKWTRQFFNEHSFRLAVRLLISLILGRMLVTNLLCFWG